MHKLRPSSLVGKTVEQAIEVLVGLRPALSREAGRLVEHECRGVLVNDHVTNELLFLGSKQLPLWLNSRGPRWRAFERRHPDFLPRLDAIAGQRPFARNPQLARSSPARDNIEADLRQVAFEPAIQPDAVVVLIDSEGAHVVHAGALSET